jgi:hypothetical protein
MTEEHEEKVTRLLDIIDSILRDDYAYPDNHLPFEVDGNGKVTFDAKLSTELAKSENQDLVDWAHEHIVGLFE